MRTVPEQRTHDSKVINRSLRGLAFTEPGPNLWFFHFCYLPCSFSLRQTHQLPVLQQREACVAAALQESSWCYQAQQLYCSPPPPQPQFQCNKSPPDRIYKSWGNDCQTLPIQFYSTFCRYRSDSSLAKLGDRGETLAVIFRAERRISIPLNPAWFTKKRL